MKSADEIDSDLTSSCKKIFLEDGTCAIIDQKLWDSLLESSKVRITKKKEKSFPCTYEGCDKSYTASHHLAVS